MFAQLSMFQQGFTGSHNLTGSTDRRTRRFGATTDNDTRNWKSREEQEWPEIVYHVRWTLGDNRQLLWGCGQIDWQVDKNAWETFSLQVHYQRMTSTSTSKRIYYCMMGRKSCGYLVWSLSVSDLHCCHFIRHKPKPKLV